MAITIQRAHPVAHLPLVLGVVRRLEVAAVIDNMIPPHPAHVLSCGRGVEALTLAILDGHHALYKVGTRLEERGMLSLLQPGRQRAALNDYRLGQILDALFAANLNRVFGALALNTLAVYTIQRLGSIRIPRRLRSMVLMKTRRGIPQRLSVRRSLCHRVQRMGTVKMDATSSNKCCSVSG